MSSEAKITPGPWQAVTNINCGDTAYVIDAKGEVIAIVNRAGDRAVIAATPDLLNALRDSQSLLVAMLGEKRPDEEIEEQIMLNRSAMNAAGDHEAVFQNWTSVMSVRSAAADLLEALRAHDRYMIHAGYSGPDSSALHPNAAENWRRSRAAVAKAIGTTP